MTGDIPAIEKALSRGKPTPFAWAVVGAMDNGLRLKEVYQKSLALKESAELVLGLNVPVNEVASQYIAFYERVA